MGIELFCVLIKRWIDAIIHLSKPMGYKTSKVSSNVNYGLWVITLCQGHSSVVTNVSLWCRISIVKEDCACREQGYMGTLLSFAVKLGLF